MLCSPLEQIEDYFCKPVDIEWCIDKKDQLWLLQVRPISLKRKKETIFFSFFHYFLFFFI